MEEKDKYPIKGACQCGQITYQVTSPPLFSVVCHCRECQKLSASAFSISMIFAREAFEIKGELKQWERSSDIGNRNIAHFCPTCGNRIYHTNPDQSEIIRLKGGGTLSDTSIIQPTAHVWVSEKQDWVTIPEGVQQHQTQPQW